MKNIINITVKKQRFNVAVEYQKGSEDLIILLHGLGCTKESFSHVFSHPLFKQYSLLAYDMIGHGDSDKPDGFSYDMKDQADVCEVLIRHFNGKNVHVVTHSMGGAVGLLLPSDRLTSIASYISAEGNLINEDCFISRKLTKESFEVFQRDLYPKFIARLEPGSDFYLSVQKCKELAFYKSSESLVYWSDNGELMKRFKNLTCRKVYFYADRNSNIPVLPLINEANKVEIKDSGHFMMADNPEGFYSELARIIGSEC